MGVVDTSEQNILAEFQTCGLPASSYARFSRYFRDLDGYYTRRGLNSPRIPRRICYRAMNMTSHFNGMIGLGLRPEFCDDYVRNYLDIPGPGLNQNRMAYLRGYAERRLRCGDTEEIIASDIATYLHSNGLELAGDGRTLFYRSECLNKKNDGMIPVGSLQDSISKMQEILKSKHLRKHCARTGNPLFLERRVICHVNEAIDTWCECAKVVDMDINGVSGYIFDDMALLFTLTEQVKDVYNLFD